MERPDPGSIAARLRALRSASGRSLEALARELGVHFTTVSAWERGRSRPNYRTLTKLAALYQVSPEYFLEEFAEERLPGKLVPGPSRSRFRRIPDRTREEIVGGLEEVRFLLLVRRSLDQRGLRLEDLQRATGLSLARLEGLLEGGARPTVSEILHLADALGIRIEEPRPADADPLPAGSSTDPDDLLAALRSVPPPLRTRLVLLLLGAVHLATGQDGARAPEEG